MDQHRRRTYAYVKQDRFVLENCESITGWAGSADVTAVALSTNHKEGSNSISFAKSLGTVVAGSITKTLSPALNLVDYYDGHLRYWAYVSATTDITSISLVIGQSASHCNTYTTLVASLSAGWNLIDVEIKSPTTVTGNGVTWTSVSYMSFVVTLDGAAKTLAGILFDTPSVLYRMDANIESVSLTGTGLATAALQTTGNAILTTIDADTGNIATSAGTIKTNTDPLVAAAGGGYVRQDSTAKIAKESGGNLADIKTSAQIMDDWDESDRAKVNLIAGQAGIMGGTVTPAIPAANMANTLPWAVYNATPTARTEGKGGTLQADVGGNLLNSLGTGLNATDDSVTAIIGASATVTGFDTVFDADGDNTAQACKTVACNLYHLHAYNSNAAGVFIQLFDLATGSVIVGTTTPKYVIYVPPTGNTIEDYDVPMSFATAATYACTTTPTGNGDPTVGLTVSFGVK